MMKMMMMMDIWIKKINLKTQFGKFKKFIEYYVFHEDEQVIDWMINILGSVCALTIENQL